LALAERQAELPLALAEGQVVLTPVLSQLLTVKTKSHLQDAYLLGKPFPLKARAYIKLPLPFREVCAVFTDTLLTRLYIKDELVAVLLLLPRKLTV